MRHFVVLVLLQFFSFADAAIFHLTIDHGTRKVIDLGAFGFVGAPNSNCTLIIREFKYFDANGQEQKQVPAPIGFSLEERDTINTARLEQNVRYENGSCFADWRRPERIVATLPIAQGGWDVPDKKYEVKIDPSISEERPQVVDLSGQLTEGFLALFFFNCNDGKFSFKVEVVQYNQVDGVKSYLSLGQSPLPLMYFGFFIIYCVCLLIWGATMTRNKAFVHKIHNLMAALLVLKAASLFFEAVQLHMIKVNGYHNVGADIVYYFFFTLKGIVLFVVILLIGTGWSFIKPFLSEKDKKILVAVLPLQVLVNLAMIVVETLNEGNRSWSTWRDALRILDIICCCAVLLPIVWSIRTLREGNNADGKVAQNLSRLRQFRTFYILVVSYIYFTRIVVVLIRSALHFRVTWAAPFIFELGTLAFYIFSGVKFSPRGQNPYLNTEPEDFDDISLRLEIESREANKRRDNA
eukprot:TRINITY_DN4441_c0_g1_i1.p1 TRINITY_DN4441_c0_g1~~TRINITY_DN4441_c0_g1_i1.p1  ORF type:complete len:465 (+),score=118.19 TRINITY_DN4441_c0_g1_i1:47-1441(+)